MRSRLLIVALGLPSVLAAPAPAQHLLDSRTVALASADRPLALSGKVLSSTSSAGVSMTRDTYVFEDGTADVREGVVGSLALADNASVGLGIYKVSRYSRGEPSFRKLRPMEDIYGRHQSIAAVGLSLRF